MSEILKPSAATQSFQQRLQATQRHGWHQPTTEEIAARAAATRNARAGVPPPLAEIQADAAAGRGAAERKP